MPGQPDPYGARLALVLMAATAIVVWRQAVSSAAAAEAAAAAAKPTQPIAIYKIRDTCATVREAAYVQGQCWQEQKHDPTVVGNRVYDGTENLHPYWKVRRVSPAMSEKSRKELQKNIAINKIGRAHV